MTYWALLNTDMNLSVYEPERRSGSYTPSAMPPIDTTATR